MIDRPQIAQTDAQITAVIHLSIPLDEIQQVMGPAIGEVIAAVSAQGIGPAGPVFSYHLRLEPDIWDFEVGVPVTAPVSPVGRVKAGQLPAVTVAQTIYHGPYENLGDGWGELMDWIETEGHKPAPNLWERYVSGPESSPDPASWRTELNRPLLG